MSPEDPSHISAVCSGIKGACYEQCTVIVPEKAPKSGGVAFKVQRGDAVFWLQAQRGRESKYGGIKYMVRNHRGVNVGPIGHVRGYHPLFEACEHLARHLEWAVPRERAPSPAWLVESQNEIRAKAYAASMAKVSAERRAAQ